MALAGEVAEEGGADVVAAGHGRIVIGHEESGDSGRSAAAGACHAAGL
jgi:hypothetical protein